MLLSETKPLRLFEKYQSCISDLSETALLSFKYDTIIKKTLSPFAIKTTSITASSLQTFCLQAKYAELSLQPTLLEQRILQSA